MAIALQTDPAAPALKLARRLAGLGTWPRLALAVGLGLLASTALPPLHLVFLLVPAFTGLLWLLSGVGSARAAFGLGWAFGFGYFLAGLYWVGIAFFVDAERFALLMPLAVGLLCGGMALFPGVAVALAWRLPGPRHGRWLMLAAAWLFAEWIRSWFLTGFPWNLVGSVWVFSDAVLQSAALAGVWGLSFVTVAAAGAPATLGIAGAGPWMRWAPVSAMAGLLLLLWAAGAWRLASAPAPGADGVEGVRLRLVQPSIEQTLKWDPELRLRNLVDQVNLSRRPGAEPVTHVIWSETAVTYSLEQEPILRRDLAAVIPPDGLLLTGAIRSSFSGGRRQVWNSFHALDGAGAIRATYDKFHLVPFGEYAPLREWLPIDKLTPGAIDFSAGPGPLSLDLPGLPPVGPLICYEVIFPGAVVQADSRPGWLLNLTNDAWFGTSSGPHQHLAAARLRAVEEGLPIVRVANSGISAVIDGYGRLLDSAGLQEVRLLDSPLPKALEPTPFARIGNAAIALLLIAALALALGLKWREAR